MGTKRANQRLLAEWARLPRRVNLAPLASAESSGE
jgi:hypothetical protein